ncbi:HvfC family peptide modification chaperone [Paraliomyxa miuraensis]|uniref:HvfC family peptide modification chaperone n=1 Tax=Paraliomyxa miuraensis TaxID=376150 RepID=UPI002257501B|nr:putative DNA-binding domain-containing protein [Paraliomyxa miuraensis]MCX4247280.1 putative DNA-binding domain-containing protein [Paraliomyxa miuraensis]
MPEANPARGPEPVVVERPTSALAAVIRRRDAPTAMREDLEGWLAAQGVEGEDLQAMLAVGAERLLVYRKLVHNRLRSTTREFLERTVARLGTERFARDFEGFMEDRASHTPYLRDVPTEFLEWVLPRWAEDPEVPRYLPDLARHEVCDYEVRNHFSAQAHEDDAPTGLPLALDRPLRFHGAARLMHYEHAVHRLSTAKDDRTEAEAEPTHLLVYRDDRHRARYLALTPFAAALLQALVVDRMAVQPALLAAAQALGEPLDDDKLASAAELLADLAERGACLGAEPETA